MSNPKTRLAVDLDDLHNQGRPKAHSDASRNDPLAELARIVGQEDPFGAVLGHNEPASIPASERRQASAPASMRAAPLRAEPTLHHPVQEPASSVSAHDPGYGDAPAAFPAYDELDYAEHAEPVHHDLEPGVAPRQPGLAQDAGRARKGLMAVGAVLGVAVLGVAGALAFRGGSSSSSTGGGPPVIQADRSPLKVQPQDPGGAEIPDQNKQIYDRRAPQGQTKVVNREEQPVDVQQAARAAAERSGTDSTSSVSSTATPGSGAGGAPATLSASLGEPRRVHTVSIKPELGASARDSQRAASPTSTAPAGSPAPSPSPSASMTTPLAPRTPPAPPVRTDATRTPAPVAAPPAAAPPAAPRAAIPADTPAPTAPTNAPQRTASITPPADPVEKASTAGGGFSVQLAVRPSDKEARAAFKELQTKFSGDLDGRSPLIKQADVNGKTVFRIRVGPLGREEANALCTKLKSSGGQCFVAKD